MATKKHADKVRPSAVPVKAAAKVKMPTLAEKNTAYPMGGESLKPRSAVKKSTTLAEKKAAIPRLQKLSNEIQRKDKIRQENADASRATTKRRTNSEIVAANKAAKAAAFPEIQFTNGSVAKLIAALQKAPRGAQFTTDPGGVEIYNSKGRRIGSIGITALK